jgi:paraquat-inducible protein B
MFLNLYLIVSNKIYIAFPSPNPASGKLEPISKYYQDLNLYYGFKKTYDKLRTLINDETNLTVSIEEQADNIIVTNSDFTNQLMITAGISGLGGLIGAVSVIGGKKKVTKKRKRNGKQNISKRLKYGKNKKNKKRDLTKKHRRRRNNNSR